MESPSEFEEPGVNAAQPADVIPQGVDLLLKLAAFDPRFRKRLLRQRARAAEAIGVRLTDAEAAMLRAAAQSQLEAIIDHAIEQEEVRRAQAEYARRPPRVESLGMRPN
jgi:hypothetical protein